MHGRSKLGVAGVLTGLLPWTLLSSAVIADDGAFLTCRGIADAAARLACYDAAVDQRPPAPPGVKGAQSAVGPGAAAVAGSAPAATGGSTQPTPEELFGHDAVKSQQIVREASGIGELQEMKVRVAGVRTNGYGKLVLTLDNGQVWSQLDTPTARIKPGEEVLIRRAAMGSYLLTRNDGGRGIRVHRDR